jgi:hypothetical protein
MKAIISFLIASSLVAQTAVPKRFGQDAMIRIPTSMRAGATNQFDGTASTCAGGCQYFWTQAAGPSTLLWSNRTASQPTVTNAVFGEYIIRLRVTAITGGATNTADLIVGAVGTDANGVVTMPAMAQTLLGFQTRHGSSVWNYQDDILPAIADAFLTENAANPLFNGSDWDTAQTGTITITQPGGAGTNPVVTGSGGTLLQTRLCGGGTTPTTDLVVWYTQATGVSGKRASSVLACSSETSVTLLLPTFPLPIGTVTGAQWSYCGGGWSGGSDNVNYYDNVAGFRLAYLRTGLTRFKTEWLRLADQWWRNPYLDRNTNVNGNLQLPPRVRANLGMMEWAYDQGRSDNEFWTPMRAYLDTACPTIGSNNDTREMGYLTQNCATAALTDPDASRAATYQGYLNSALTAWQNLQYTGVWGNSFNPPISAGTVSIAGGVNVTLTGGTFSSTVCSRPAGYFVSLIQLGFTTDTYRANGTKAACTWVDSTHITLATAFDGAGTSGLLYTMTGYEANAPYYGGYGVQPFIMSLTARNLSIVVGAATNSTTIAGFQSIADTMNTWNLANAFDSATKGMYYMRLNEPCSPIGTAPTIGGMCRFNSATQSEVWASRFDSLEGLSGPSRGYLPSQLTATKNALDEWAGAMFGKTGYSGPNVDGEDARELFDQVGNPNKHRDFGFCCGVGNVFHWTAARLGGPAVVNSTNYTIPYLSLRSSTSMVITVTGSNGSISSTTCTSGVCAFSVDRNRGDVRVSIEWKIGAAVVASNANFPVMVAP